MPGKDLTRWAINEDGSYSRHPGFEDGTIAEATKGAEEAAEELGVDLATVTGSGKDGKITKADVEAAVAKEA